MLGKLLKENRVVLIPYCMLLILLIPVFILFDKSEIHIWMNQYHSAFFDIFFALITYLGDGLFLILPALILLCISLRHFVFLLTAYFSSGLITQILKRLFFEDYLRPIKHFSDNMILYLIDGVHMLKYHSFPSGHSTSSFALFFSLAFIIPNRYLKFTCFVTACFVAFSRVYLSQHFLMDILAGSIIGSICALGAWLIYYRNEQKWHTWTVQQAFRHDNRK